MKVWIVFQDNWMYSVAFLSETKAKEKLLLLIEQSYQARAVAEQQQIGNPYPHIPSEKQYMMREIEVEE